MAKSNEKKRDFFWLSYSDLMTSLFFVMLVLFVLVYTMQSQMIAELNANNKELKAAKEELDEIHRIQKALENLDNRYFDYDAKNKRYKLKVDLIFEPDEADIYAVSGSTLYQIKMAGMQLKVFMNRIVKENPDITYLLVIEGNTQRTTGNFLNYIEIPDEGYKLSYERALSLLNYWKDDCNLDFRNLRNCEIILAGSGYFGKSRQIEEYKNRRFTIQITPKLGAMKKKK